MGEPTGPFVFVREPGALVTPDDLRAGRGHVERALLEAGGGQSGARFGATLAASAGTLAVGAPEDAIAAQGVGSDPSDASGMRNGAVPVFALDGGTSVHRAYLKGSDTREQDRFGTAIALDD